MINLSVERDKCRKDGICTAVCPLRVIGIDESGFPYQLPGAGSLCNMCGHCVAACPHGALSLGSMRPEDCEPVRKEALPGPDQVGHLLRARRSIRAFKDQSIDHDVLSGLIDTARHAPTAKNLQHVNWLVAGGKSEVRHLSGLAVDWVRSVLREKAGDEVTLLRMKRIVDAWEQGECRICHSAPHIIIAHSPKIMAYGRTDCAIALTYLELAAYSLGLGACWAGYFEQAARSYPPLRQALQLPEENEVYGAMLVGYSKYSYYRVPLRKKPAITWL